MFSNNNFFYVLEVIKEQIQKLEHSESNPHKFECQKQIYELYQQTQQKVAQIIKEDTEYQKQVDETIQKKLQEKVLHQQNYHKTLELQVQYEEQEVLIHIKMQELEGILQQEQSTKKIDMGEIKEIEKKLYDILGQIRDFTKIQGQQEDQQNIGESLFSYNQPQQDQQQKQIFKQPYQLEKQQDELVFHQKDQSSSNENTTQSLFENKDLNNIKNILKKLDDSFNNTFQKIFKLQENISFYNEYTSEYVYVSLQNNQVNNYWYNGNIKRIVVRCKNYSETYRNTISPKELRYNEYYQINPERQNLMLTAFKKLNIYNKNYTKEIYSFYTAQKDENELQFDSAKYFENNKFQPFDKVFPQSEEQRDFQKHLDETLQVKQKNTPKPQYNPIKQEAGIFANDNYGGGLFGNNPGMGRGGNNNNNGGGLFGNNNNNNNQRGGLFGGLINNNANNINNNRGGGLFGNNTNNYNQEFFVGPTTNNPNNNLFGKNDDNNNNGNNSGLFGGYKNNNNNNNTGLFGSNSNNNNNNMGLFGNSTNSSNEQGLFGSNNNAFNNVNISRGIFGNNDQEIHANTGGLFLGNMGNNDTRGNPGGFPANNNNNNRNEGIFGNSGNNQEQNNGNLFGSSKDQGEEKEGENCTENNNKKEEEAQK